MNPTFQLLDPAKAEEEAPTFQLLDPEKAEEGAGLAEVQTPDISTSTSTQDPVNTFGRYAQISPDQEKQAVQDALASAHAQSASGTGQLASTKPSWYQGGPPPARSTGMDIASALANAGAAGAQRQA